MTDKYPIPALTVVLLTAALSGCGGGGGGGGDDDSTNGGDDEPLGDVADLGGCYAGLTSGAAGDPPTTETLEFFTGSLSAVDPSSPGAVIPLDASAKADPAPAPVLDGAWQGDGDITSPAVAHVVYQDGSNVLRRVNTDPAQSQNTIRVSSEDQAVDAFLVGHDFRQPLNACIAYRLASGGDWKITRLGADGSTAPQDFPGEPIVAFNDGTTGAHDGWLTLAGGELRRVFGDGPVGDGLKSSISSLELLDMLPDGTTFLNIDAGLYAYDPAAGTLSGKLHDFPEAELSDSSAYFRKFAPEFVAADDQELYFADEFVLYRSDLATESSEIVAEPAQILRSTSPSVGADLLFVTPDRVAWSYQTVNSEQIVESIAKSNTSDNLELDRFDTSTEQLDVVNRDTQPVFARSGSWIFYTVRAANGSSVRAVARRDDDSNVETINSAAWIGANLNPRPGSDMAAALEQIYLLTGITSTSDPDGGSFASIAAANPASTTALGGTVPSNVFASTNPLPVQLGGGIGPTRLGTINVNPAGVTRADDVFFLDGTTASSYERITSENGSDEVPVALF